MDIGLTTQDSIMKSPSWKHQKSLDSSVPVSQNVKTRSGGECIYPVCKMRRRSITTAPSRISFTRMVRPYSRVIYNAEDVDLKETSLPENITDSPTGTGASKDGVVYYNEEKRLIELLIEKLRKAEEMCMRLIKNLKEDLATEIPKRNALIVEMNVALLDIKNQMTSLEQHIASLETNSEESSENRKAKIVEYKEKLELLAARKKVYEQETFDLNKEIYEYLNKLLNMNLVIEKLKRLSAEADLSMLKVEDALKKGEHEAAMAEYESFKVRFEEECPRFEEQCSQCDS